MPQPDIGPSIAMSIAAGERPDLWPSGCPSIIQGCDMLSLFGTLCLWKKHHEP